MKLAGSFNAGSEFFRPFFCCIFLGVILFFRVYTTQGTLISIF